MTTTELVSQFIDVKAQIDELKTTLAAVQTQAEAISLELLERFADEAIDKMSVRGHTVFSRRQLWAGHENKDDKSALIVALKSDPSTTDLVALEANTARLSSWMRELPKSDDDDMPIIPKHLIGKMKVTEKFQMVCRKS